MCNYTIKVNILNQRSRGYKQQEIDCQHIMYIPHSRLYSCMLSKLLGTNPSLNAGPLAAIKPCKQIATLTVHMKHMHITDSHIYSIVIPSMFSMTRCITRSCCNIPTNFRYHSDICVSAIRYTKMIIIFYAADVPAKNLLP